MSAAFKIHASEQDYQVEIAVGLLVKTLANIKGDTVFICDAALAERIGCDPKRTIVIEATEYAKDLANLSSIMGQFKELGGNRKTMLYAIGGGVIQDIACFVASTYMRGLKWAYFPTTLLGMVDSCIGGKSSINAGGFKNLVGTIHPPEAVYIDPTLADTLNTEQKVAGLAEAIKICFAHEGNYFEEYLALDPKPQMDSKILGEVIALSLKTKKWFIEIDEFDQKERLLLNFGHTFGHAIEAATHFSVSHGVAVGIGMLCALAHAKMQGYTPSGATRAEKLLRHIKELLAAVPSLKETMAGLDAKLATQKFTADKKHDSEHYWIIAPNNEGYLRRIPLPKTSASLTHIESLFIAAKDYHGL